MPDTTPRKRRPITPHALATTALARDRQRRHRRALENHEYATLVAREPDDVRSLMRESAILHEIPEARWTGIARWVARRPVRRRIEQLRSVTQRARRGWDDTVLWDLDHHLCGTLGAQLELLAERSHGWPDDSYEAFDDWIEALHVNAAKLTTYANEHVETGRSSDPEVLPVTGRSDERALRDAQDALHWVADNLGSLWD